MQRVAIVHDYLTQRGGAERVVLEMTGAFPDAPVFTSLYDPAGTFPEFAGVDVRPGLLNRVRPLRADHRLALPLLAPAFSLRHLRGYDAVLCSSSGWAHGISTDARKVVYCYAPARWLHQTDYYLGRTTGLPRLALKGLKPLLSGWDRRAAASADSYLTSSSVVRDRIGTAYGIDATVVPPPPALAPDGPETPVAGVEPGYLLVVSRLLPYKNVDVALETMRLLPEHRLVVVGDGPQRAELAAAAPCNARLLGKVDDAGLRWLYRHCLALVAVSYEDYGLTPLEANAFGRPSVALRAGGYLDTVVDEETGLFVDDLTRAGLAAAVREVCQEPWPSERLTAHAATFSPAAFHQRLREAMEPAGCGVASRREPASAARDAR